MKSKLFTLIVFFLLVTKGFLYAQQTGNFNVSINFMGQQRTLALYVPTNYNSNQQYRLLVGLHGFGGNGASFRNTLVGSSLHWQTLFPNTIFICPDGSAQGNHYEPAGYEEIIQKSIDYAKGHYNIDSSDIILEGFSFGGRSALAFGLSHFQEFRALLLNTPAIQGVVDAFYGIPLNGSNFTYQNASHLPIYITLGADDLPYVPPVDSMFEQLVANNGVVRYHIISGLGHAIPATSGMVMQGFLPFVNHPYSQTPDVDLLKIKIMPRSCQSSVLPKCWVRNLGPNTIHNITLHYLWNGSTNSLSWQGSLAPFAQTNIALPTLTALPGVQSLTVMIDSVDYAPDTISDNNAERATYEWMDQSHDLPLSEGFEQTNIFPPDGWLLNRIGDYYIGDWGEATDDKKSGIGSAFCFNTMIIFYNKGHSSELLSPLLNLSSVSLPYLTFDYAYNYHHWGLPFYNSPIDLTDTLKIAVSTDCGAHWETVFKKSGTELSTFTTPIVNPQSVDAAMIRPGLSDWRTDSISLTDFGNTEQAVVKFIYTSGRGGSIVLDNILFTGNATGIASNYPENDVRIWPNPARDQIFIHSNSRNVNSIAIMNLSRKVLKRLTGIHLTHGQSLKLNTGQISTGLYFLKITSDKGLPIIKKINIIH